MWKPPADEKVTNSTWTPPEDERLDKTYQPTLLERVAPPLENAAHAVLDPVARAGSTLAKGASNVMFGTEVPAEMIEKGIHKAVGGYNQAIENGVERLADPNSMVNRAVSNVVLGPVLGNTGVGREAMANPYVGGAIGLAAENAPFMVPVGSPTKYTTELSPAVGKPGIAARIKQMRTGVEAGDFERLRRDPTAFFNPTERSEAGKAVGAAKEAAGINTGVTSDIKSLTPENISKARNIQGEANKAQDAVISRIEKGEPIEANEVSTALEGINKRLSKLERSEGRGSPSFQQWSVIKTHFQNLLEQVAPDVKQANKDFSRVALRDKFMEPFPVNQSGTMSKIDAWGFGPGAAGVGALIGGPIGAVGGLGTKMVARSPFVAGLGTAVRGLADKALDPFLTGTIRGLSNRPAYAAFIDKVTTK